MVDSMLTNSPKQNGRRVTIAEIANAAGVSKSTVSLVLNNTSNLIPISDSTRQRVLDAAKTLGYRPNAAARSLVTGRSNTILMAVVGAKDHHLFERVQGAEAYLAPLRYPLHMCTVDQNVGLSPFFEVIRSDRADGILLTGFATEESNTLLRQLYEEAKSLSKPVVGIANAFPQEYVDAVPNVDDISGAKYAVSHLIEHGHRRIAMIGIANQPWSSDRLKGYYLAHKEADIPVDTGLIKTVNLDSNLQGSVADAVKELISGSDFTALFVVLDMMAIAAISALKSSGRNVPDDCAIIGYDNDELYAAFTAPPLTTVKNPFYEQGIAAAQLLVSLIEGKKVDSIQLPVSLVVRRSCGCSI